MLRLSVTPWVCWLQAQPGPTVPASAPSATDTASVAASTTTVVADPPWWHLLLDNAFALTLVFLFLTAVITLIVQQRRRDKCLKLLSGYQVNYLTHAGQALWGNLIVFSQGVELEFDAPYRTARGMIKTSALIYQADLASCLAICRVGSALCQSQQRKRDRQVKRSFRPNVFRRTDRSIRNLLNSLRDAFSKALGLLLGQLAKARPQNVVLQSHRGSVEQIGQTFLGRAGNAYEPILEHHIGKPVIVQLGNPAQPDVPAFELPGYLVDYSESYLAVFNVQHQSLERLTLEPTEDMQHNGLSITFTPQHVTMTHRGTDVWVVERVEIGQRVFDLQVALLPGCRLALPRDQRMAELQVPDDTDAAQLPKDHHDPIKLVLERTRQIDLVCPRALAKVHFGAADDSVDEPLGRGSQSSQVGRRAGLGAGDDRGGHAGSDGVSGAAKTVDENVGQDASEVRADVPGSAAPRTTGLPPREEQTRQVQSPPPGVS